MSFSHFLRIENKSLFYNSKDIRRQSGERIIFANLQRKFTLECEAKQDQVHLESNTELHRDRLCNFTED